MWAWEGHGVKWMRNGKVPISGERAPAALCAAATCRLPPAVTTAWFRQILLMLELIRLARRSTCTCQRFRRGKARAYGEQWRA